MKNAEKRFLKFHFPEIANNEKLPSNYCNIQLFTGLEHDKNGIASEIQEDILIVASEYKIPKIRLYPVFCKPISKCFEIK
jgi:hypothetical protein